MEQLLRGGPDANPPPRPSQVVDQKLSVLVSQRRRAVPAGYELLSLIDSIHEVRCGGVESAHPGMKSRERVSVVAGEGLGRRHRLVVSPQRQSEAVRLVDARLDSRIGSGHGTRHRVEAFRQLDLERGDLATRMGHTGDDVTGHQTSRERVRVVKDDSMVGGQAQPGGRRQGSVDRTPDVGCMHDWIVDQGWARRLDQ